MIAPDIEELQRVASAVADAAAGETLPRFRRPMAAEDKGAPGCGFDPVTEADRAAEAAMRAVLARLRPDDGILGEEEDAVRGTSGLTWTLDPIDGTRAFLAGAPTWGTLIACGPDEGAPIVGLIDQPYIGERFAGGPGGATVTRGTDRKTLMTRELPALSEAILLSTFPEIGTPEEAAAFGRVAARARLTRYGLDCYGYALVAGGHADLVIEAGLAPYDIRGPMAVVRAAGGIVTAWDGGPAESGGRIVAAGCAAVHAEAVAFLRCDR